MKPLLSSLPCLFPLTLALLLPSVLAQAAPPKPDFANLPGYFAALKQSTDPAALAIAAQIAAGPADLARERVLAEKDGLLTRLEQLQRPLPPPDQNAAPLYGQLDRLRKQNPLHVPMYAQPLRDYAYTPEQIAVVQKEYDAHKDLFTLLHEAADKPQCVFVHDYSPGASGGLFTMDAGLRENARELNTESLLLAYQGKYTEAATDQERGFQIADQVASEPEIISYLVGCAIDAITESGLQIILSKAGPNAELDSQVEKDILALPLLSLGRTLRSESAIADAEFSMLRQASPAALALGTPAASHLSPAPPASAQFSPAETAQFNRLVDASEADYLHRMRLFVPAADLPRPGREALLQLDTPADPQNPIAIIGVLLSPRFDLFSEDSDRVATRRLVTAAGASVLAARARTGAFPAALPSQYTDPYTDKPLGYHIEGTGGFVVYSVGPAKDFNGGNPGDSKGANIFFRYPLVSSPVPESELKP